MPADVDVVVVAAVIRQSRQVFVTCEMEAWRVLVVVGVSNEGEGEERKKEVPYEFGNGVGASSILMLPAVGFEDHVAGAVLSQVPISTSAFAFFFRQIFSVRRHFEEGARISLER